MDKKKYWLVLFNPLAIALYGLGLYVLYRLLWLGNIKKRVPILVVIFVLLVIWVIGWSLYYFKYKKTISFVEKLKKPMICISIELLVIAIMTGYCGYRVYLIAQPFTGKLGNYLYEYDTKKQVRLTHQNFNDTGLEGVLEDIDNAITLPEELYVSNYLEIVYNQQGLIQTIDGFLYGKDENDQVRSYLIDYNKDKSRYITIWLDGYTKTPFLQSDLLISLDKTTTQDEQGLYHARWSKNKTLQEQEKQPESHLAGDFTEDENGNLHYYLDQDKVYSLIVVDAALGSRYYIFKGNGIENDEPFGNQGGVATDMYFEDEEHGYIILNNASGDNPRKYVTSDGGRTFQLEK